MSVAATAAAALLAACAQAPAAAPAASAQVVTVEAASTGSTSGTLRLWERRDGCWRSVAGPWRAWLGRNGVSAHHREGDGTTPLGTFGLGATMYGVAPDPGVSFRYHRLVCGDWWDEDPGSSGYDRFRHVRCGLRPAFGGGSEALWEILPQYRYFAEIRANPAHVPGRGSAIFLHVSAGRPTNGCVSLPQAELVAILRRLRPASSPVVAIRTQS